MKTRAITISILIAVTLGLVGWDIYVALTPQKDDTISEVILDYAGEHPVVPFGLGVVMGHLLWPQRAKRKE